MLGMMGSDRRERGVQMGNKAVMDVISQALLGNVTGSEPAGVQSPSNLRDAGGAVMRALQSGNVDAFTAALQRFILVVDEMEDDDENPFGLEVD